MASTSRTREPGPPTPPAATSRTRKAALSKPRPAALGDVVLIRLEDGWRPAIAAQVLQTGEVDAWLLPLTHDHTSGFLRSLGVQRSPTPQPIFLRGVPAGTAIGHWMLKES